MRIHTYTSHILSHMYAHSYIYIPFLHLHSMHAHTTPSSFLVSGPRLWDLRVWLTVQYLRVLLYWRLVPPETETLLEQMQA